MIRTERATHPEALQRGHEQSDVRPRGVAYAVLGLFVTLFVSGALLAVMFVVFQHNEERPVVSRLSTISPGPPEPRLQISAPTDRAAIEATAAAKFDGIGWSDRDAGLAHIPIEEAMRLLVNEGWAEPEESEQP